MDTNVVSELVRPRPDENALAWLEANSAIVISVVTVEELAFGIARAPTPRRKKLSAWLDALLATARMLDVDSRVARAAGELRAARASRGRPSTSADMLIAGTALVHGLVVATRNVSDFEGCGVSIVDPFAP